MPLQISDIPGVARWYKSADATKNGSNQLTAWTDSSGNAQDATGAFATTRTLVLANQFNGGIQGVRTTAVNAPAVQFPRITNARTVFVVVKAGPNAATANNQGAVIGDGTVRTTDQTTPIIGSPKYFNSDPTGNASTLNASGSVRVNGVPTLPHALNCSSAPDLITLEFTTDAAFDRLAGFPFGNGGEYVYAEAIISTSNLSSAQRNFIEADLMAKYGITPNQARKVIFSKVDSIGNGWWGRAISEHLAKDLNGANLIAGTPVAWDTAIDGLPGYTVATDWPLAAHRNATVRLLSGTNRPCKVFMPMGGTNDIASYATGFTAAVTFSNLCNEIDHARASGATIVITTTLLDRGRYGTQVADQAAFDAKREAFNALVRANVYPVGHAKAGQKLADAVSDFGSQTIPFAMTVSDGTNLAAGADNPIGKNNATFTAGMFKYWASTWGETGIGTPMAGTNANRNDGIHPSLLGTEIMKQMAVATLSTVLPTSVTISPSAPTVSGTQQFTAAVLPGTANQAVTWTCSAGSINSSGLFTAPAETSVPQNVTVTATSAADNTIIGTTTVTVPVAQASSFTLTGPISGAKGVASTNFIATPANGVYTGTITPSAGAGGGTFTPTSLTWTGDATAKTFTYTPATVGAKSITATANPVLSAPSAVSYTSLDVTSPVLASAVVNSAGTTLTLTFTEVDSLPILPSTGVTGFTLSGGHTLSAGTRATSTTITYTISPVVMATETITVSYSGGNVTDSATTPNVLAPIFSGSVTNNSTQVPQATSFTLTGPASGLVGYQSGLFTVTPIGGDEYSGTIAPSDGGNGGTFAPPSLTWAAENVAKTFVYTPASFGEKAISATANPSLTVPPAVTYTSNALPVVANPVFTGNTTFFNTTSVAITTATAGATIRYTTDGSAPSESNGTVYAGPITITDTTTIKAVAYKAVSTSSAVMTSVYVKQEYVPGTISYEDAQAIAAAVWSYSQRTVANSVVVGGGSILVSDEQGMETDQITAYAGDILPLALTLTTSDGLPLPLSDYTLSAVLSDASYGLVSPAPAVEVISAGAGKVIATVTVPASTGRYRLTVKRTKGITEQVTHGLVVLNVVRR